jgi:hypothetical protein
MKIVVLGVGAQNSIIAIYDGIWTHRFIPFWWSPETAFEDMAAEPVNFINGKFQVVPPYNDPRIIDFRGLGPRRVVDHEHEEPVTFGLLSQKGVQGLQERHLQIRRSWCGLTVPGGRRAFASTVTSMPPD